MILIFEIIGVYETVSRENKFKKVKYMIQFTCLNKYNTYYAINYNKKFSIVE